VLIGRRTSARDRETGNREIKVGKYDAAAAFRERAAAATFLQV
jgi:hypothetical protein